MIPESIVKALLFADAQVTAIAGDRIYPGMLPAGKRLPAVVYRRIDVTQLHRPIAPTAQTFYLCRARMRVAVLTPEEGGYVIAKTLVQHIRRAVGNKQGELAGYAGTVIGAPMLSPEQPDTEDGISVDSMDFMVTYREPV
jgi:hypothetical protein